MWLPIRKWLTISQLAQKENTSWFKVRAIIKRFNIPIKKERIQLEEEVNVAKGKGWLEREARKRKRPREVLMVDYYSWLEIPTYLRKKLLKIQKPRGKYAKK